MSRKTRNITYIAAVAALICVGAMVSIPFSIPVTLQTFVIFLSLFLLGGKLSVAAVTVYIFIGIVGLPVFSGFSGGIGRLFDPSGGFIVGFIPMALVYLLLSGNSRRRNILAAAAALAVLYTVAVIWYAVFSSGGAGAWAILMVTVLPFVIPDVIKLTLAYFLAKRLEKYIKP